MNGTATMCVKSDPGKLEKSQLYSAAEGGKFIDETERVRRFKKIRTHPLFDQLDDYVAKMNERDELFEFILFHMRRAASSRSTMTI